MRGRGPVSRNALGYNRAKPSFVGASMGQDPLQRLAMDKNFDARIKAVETKSGAGSFSSDNQAPVTKAPAQANLAVDNAGTNFLSVAITNPEFINPKLNPSRTPVIHQVEYSTSPTFASDVNSLPPSTQTHYIIPTKGASIYVRLKSSFDAAQFNQAQVTGPHL